MLLFWGNLTLGEVRRDQEITEEGATYHCYMVHATFCTIYRKGSMHQWVKHWPESQET